MLAFHTSCPAHTHTQHFCVLDDNTHAGNIFVSWTTTHTRAIFSSFNEDVK